MLNVHNLHLGYITDMLNYLNKIKIYNAKIYHLNWILGKISELIKPIRIAIMKKNRILICTMHGINSLLSYYDAIKEKSFCSTTIWIFYFFSNGFGQADYLNSLCLKESVFFFSRYASKCYFRAIFL